MSEEAMTHEQAANERTILGFWLYLMSDVLIFACLFAVYAVLRGNTFGGPGITDIVTPPLVFWETMLLLTSSFTAGLGMLTAYRGERMRSLALIVVTLLLGWGFLALEGHEFIGLIAAGHGPSASGFLSAYFALVGTHGLHVFLGTLWMLILLVQIAWRGLGGSALRRLTMLTLFWHFLDIVWIFIFTVVYLIPFV